jgi:hypothetical protein
MKSMLKFLLLFFCLLTTVLSSAGLLFSFYIKDYNTLNLPFLSIMYLVTSLILSGFSLYLLKKK